MSLLNPGPSNGDPDDPLIQGILDFYSSQADVVLAQYNNINQLLGQTKDWTHPGTHCEVLLRNFFRRNILAWMNVDKGYIFGRTERGGKTCHSPEVDLLIHNTHKFRPIFRLDDFVIVQPEATLGIIQVKRTLDTDQCRNGIENVTEAKWHVLQRVAERRGAFAVSQIEPIFCALVGFAHDMSKGEQFTATICNYLSNLAQRFPLFVPEKNRGQKVSMLPEFIGSINGCFAVYNGRTDKQQSYAVFDSIQGQTHNVALQSLLLAYTNALWQQFYDSRPPFVLPRDMTPVGEFTVELRST
jgi:hypothetical protein